MSLPSGKHGERLQEIRAEWEACAEVGWSRPLSIGESRLVLSALEAAEADARQKEAALQAARGVLFALPKACQSQRRSEVLALVNRALGRA